MGTIITFYSFKGGVGRTMALANIAILLANQGYKVLTIDWDLEAPGLDKYFSKLSRSNYNVKKGLIDLITESINTNNKIINYLIKISKQLYFFSINTGLLFNLFFF